MAGDRKPVRHVSLLSLTLILVMSHGRTVMSQLPQLEMPPPGRAGPGWAPGWSRPANPEAKAKVRELEGSPGIVSQQLATSLISAF